MSNLPETLGGCRIIERFGQGGMSPVYRGCHAVLGHEVAIKILPRELAGEKEYVERFMREARALIRIQDPHLVNVYGAGQEQGCYFITMELVDGQDLQTLLEREGPLEERKGLDFLAQAAQGLFAAHSQGLIHRNLKPKNLILNRKGVLKIANFDLAADQESQAQLTIQGTILGTAAYMSPEQADGKPADARSDLYALGATFYKLLTGQPPFKGTTALAILFQHKNAQPENPQRLNPGLSFRTCQLLLKLLAKKPEDRYQDGRSLAEAAKEIQVEDEPTLRPASLLSLASASPQTQPPPIPIPVPSPPSLSQPPFPSPPLPSEPLKVPSQGENLDGPVLPPSATVLPPSTPEPCPKPSSGRTELEQASPEEILPDLPPPIIHVSEDQGGENLPDLPPVLAPLPPRQEPTAFLETPTPRPAGSARTLPPTEPPASAQPPLPSPPQVAPQPPVQFPAEAQVQPQPHGGMSLGGFERTVVNPPQQTIQKRYCLRCGEPLPMGASPCPNCEPNKGTFGLPSLRFGKRVLPAWIWYMLLSLILVGILVFLFLFAGRFLRPPIPPQRTQPLDINAPGQILDQAPGDPYLEDTPR